MKVVFVDSTIAIPPTGGAHTFLVNLCTAMTAQGHHVSVVAAPGMDDTIPALLQSGGAAVVMNLWSPGHLPEERANRLGSWINQEHPDVYIVSVSPDAGWLALPLLDPSIATLSIAHNDVSAFYDPLKHYNPFVDCAIGVSKAIQRAIVCECSIPAARSRYIPYGVKSLLASGVTKLAEHKLENEPLRIGYIGRLVQEQKRVRDFVSLALELKRRKIPFELHLIGEGPERSTLEIGFQRNDVMRNIRFWGWLTPEAVRERLRELDALILLSDYEGLPLALLEAMGHGVVPVVTNLEGGNADVVTDGENGFLLAVGDISAFVDRLQLLAGDRSRLALMRQAAWETSQDYSLDKMVQCYERAFQEAVARTSRRTQRDGLTRQYPVMASCKSRYPFWLRKLKRRVLSIGFPTAVSLSAGSS